MQTGFQQVVRGDGLQGRRIQRRGVGGVVAAAKGQLDPRDIRQITKVGDGFKPLKKRGHFSAVKHQHGAVWLMLAQEHARHRLEEFVTDKFVDDGESDFERFGQADGDIVAVDGKAFAGGGALGIAQAFGDGQVRVQDGLCKVGLAAHAGAFSRIVVARAASAASAGHSGTLASHSIKAGRAPVLLSV